MSKEKIDMMVDAGKAVSTPEIGQKLGPLGINIQHVLTKINDKTASFAGMKVPVKVVVDTSSKDIAIEVGTPPVSELIKKEVGVEKGSQQPNKNKIANLALEQVVKIAKMKQEGMLVNSLKAAVKSVIGSCNSLGILVEGRTAHKIIQEIDSGNYDDIIASGKTEISQERKHQLKLQLEEFQKELQKEQERLKALEEVAPVKEEKKEEVKEEVKPGKEETGKEVKPAKEVKEKKQ